VERYRMGRPARRTFGAAATWRQSQGPGDVGRCIKRGLWSPLANEPRPSRGGSRKRDPVKSGGQMMTIHISHDSEIVLIAVALWVSVMYALVRITRH